MLAINGAPVASPAYFRVTVFDVATSLRNALGGAVVDSVCRKRRLEARWTALSAQETSALLAALSGAAVSVTYPDPETGADRTCVCRALDRHFSILRRTAQNTLWGDAAVVLEEQ